MKSLMGIKYVGSFALFLSFGFIFCEKTSSGWDGPGEKFYQYRGYIESDIRLTLPLKDAAGVGDYNFIRSDGTFRLKSDFNLSSRTKAVADCRIVFTGMFTGDSFADLSYREKIDPFRIENDALYLQVVDFLSEGVDLRLGRQVIIWGTADKFNPTSNLNSLDLEDPIMFGEAIANEMLSITYTPAYFLEMEEERPLEEVSFQLVLVPIFRPSQLPFWSGEAFTSPDLFSQQVTSDELLDLISLQEIFTQRGGRIRYDVRVRKPDIELKNVAFGMKLSWILWGVDMSVSYYRGFDDMPVPERIYASDIHLNSWPSSTGGSLEDLITDINLTGVEVNNKITLTYPRIQVIGGDFSTSVDKLGGLGLWGEIGFYFHSPLYYHIRTSGVWAPGMGGQEVYIPVDESFVVKQVRGNWFWKLTTGVDYSIFYWWYINVQYMHGFIDEFGAENLHDYIVAGSDFKFFAEKLLFRLFAIWCVNEDDLSFVVYPELKLSFWRSTQLSIGGLIYDWRKETKFGSPLAGPSMIFVKGRISI